MTNPTDTERAAGPAADVPAGIKRAAGLSAAEEAELEAMRRAAYPNPEEQDRGETLMWTGAGFGAAGLGVVAAAAICPACMVGLAPLAAVAAPVVFGAGLIKRWHKGRKDRLLRVGDEASAGA